MRTLPEQHFTGVDELVRTRVASPHGILYLPRPLPRRSLHQKGNYQERLFILIDGLVAGRIFNQPRSDGKTVWFWSVTGPYIPPELQPTNGEAETLEVAQQALKVKFLQWQRWAIAESKEAAWHA
jgi:hypothetical protein